MIKNCLIRQLFGEPRVESNFYRTKTVLKAQDNDIIKILKYEI